MMKPKSRFIVIASIAGLLAFIGDFLVTFALGFFYPNYNHLKLVQSELGTSQSPVAVWINLWWIVFGILFITFAIGFKKTFASDKKSVVIVTLLMMLFGLGAGIGAGLFSMDPGGLETTFTGKLHGICAGIGFLAITFVPLVSLTMFPRKRSLGLYWLSVGVFVLGLASLVLFVASENASSTEGLLSYAGLWQRLFRESRGRR
ncbi:MAG: DUF998 domain-containing protein [Bacteroidetes bacterium]|nr:DUF998 domain-containing protein [Bacteroidota bacterium]